MKYFIIAGERSGDLHGGNLVKALKKADNEAVIMAWGGDYMQESGAKILKNYKELAFMGFLEVVVNLFKILSFFSECKKQISEFQPDAIILIDYAGFNLRIAKWAKKENFKVFYYISPKVWAWNQKRAFGIKKTVDKLFVIFPFEVDFFKKNNFEVEYVGNPLLDSISDFKQNSEVFFEKNGIDLSKKIIALLPGSRKQEVENMLIGMSEIVSEFPDYQFIIAGVSNLENNLYEKYISEKVRIVFDQTYDLLSVSEAALVTSGTATLETALFEIPQVVCYKANWFSFQIAKRLIRVPYISLVNLIAQKEVVKELIQDNLSTKKLIYELKNIIENQSLRNKQISDYKEIKKILNKPNASENVGKRVVEILRKE